MKPQGGNLAAARDEEKKNSRPKEDHSQARGNVQGVGLDAETKILWHSSRRGSISLDIPSYRTAPTKSPVESVAFATREPKIEAQKALVLAPSWPHIFPNGSVAGSLPLFKI